MNVLPTHEFVAMAMSTTVSVQIVGDYPNATALAGEALDWFRLVEATCTRFDPASELQRLCHVAPERAHVSPLLFEVLRVALAVAEASGGAFDPTLGCALHARGFDAHWQSASRAPVPPQAVDGVWRTIRLDESQHTVTLPQRTLLDLGGVAKGFALDLAARALAAVADCCVVAGGDLWCRGLNANGTPWRTAIVDPFDTSATAAVVEVNAPEFAICTSGDYRRRTPEGHHLLDPRGAMVRSAGTTHSVTVIAPQAAIADALATAAFVLGPTQAIPLLEEQAVDAYIVDEHGRHHTVHGWRRSIFAAPGA